MIINTVIVVGSGPAGIGIASLLNQSNINYTVLEKNNVGNSFLEWPKNMDMITPSFPSNAFGQIDLNSVCETTSPAFSFNKEHLSGEEYAECLVGITEYFNLNIQCNTEVKKVNRNKSGWVLDTNNGSYFCSYLIWATGEFKNPQINNILGATNCIHSSLIKYPNKLEGDSFVIIGGYESGVQMACELIDNNKKVTIINPFEIDDFITIDPSKVLSPHTYNKYKKIKKNSLYNEILGEVTSVTLHENNYTIHLTDSSYIKTKQMPICATGFSLVDGPIKKFIKYRRDGIHKLIEKTDEFFGQKNIYLSGPSVRHENHIFCFIYKFRQRFGVIVEDIFKKKNYSENDISTLVNRWKVNGMYLSDLSCCDEECIC